MEKTELHWREYWMEAAGLAGFVLGAGLLSIFLNHPDLPVMKSWLKDYPLLRRVPLGIIMGAYIYGLTMLWGKKSGAHINPALTWAFFRLGKISFADGLLYTIAQFAGAVIGAQLLKLFLGHFFGNPVIDYGVTKPMPPLGAAAAFSSEFIISFILMMVILYMNSYRRFEKYAALVIGLLIAFYLVVEIPFSGMSLNPARSFAGAFAASEWNYLWIYFVSPLLAMLAAAELFTYCLVKNIIKRNNDYQELLYYPVKNTGEQ